MITPPFKLISGAVGFATLLAFQAGEVAGGGAVSSEIGEVINLVIATLSSVGVFTFLKRWWERRQDKLDQREASEADELARLRHDLIVMTGYANRAYQAAVAAGSEMDPPPALTPPPGVARPSRVEP